MKPEHGTERIKMQMAAIDYLSRTLGRSIEDIGTDVHIYGRDYPVVAHDDIRTCCVFICMSTEALKAKQPIISLAKKKFSLVYVIITKDIKESDAIALIPKRVEIIKYTPERKKKIKLVGEQLDYWDSEGAPSKRSYSANKYKRLWSIQEVKDAIRRANKNTLLRIGALVVNNGLRADKLAYDIAKERLQKTLESLALARNEIDHKENIVNVLHSVVESILDTSAQSYLTNGAISYRQWLHIKPDAGKMYKLKTASGKIRLLEKTITDTANEWNRICRRCKHQHIWTEDAENRACINCSKIVGQKEKVRNAVERRERIIRMGEFAKRRLERKGK